MLVAAAWLHDIEYSTAIGVSGFHPLDGAVHLRAAGWDGRIVSLVAHHSGARFVPEWRGFGPAMAEFEFEETAVSDALTFADQTVGHWGRRMTMQERMAEATRRHGPMSRNAQLRIDRVPYLNAVTERVELRLADNAQRGPLIHKSRIRQPRRQVDRTRPRRRRLSFESPGQ